MSRVSRPVAVVGGLLACVTAAVLLPGAASAAQTDVGFAKVETTVRTGPTTTAIPEQELFTGDEVTVVCWVTGEPTYGTDHFGSMWLKVLDTPGTDEVGYVHSFLVTPVDVDEC